jgi:hypothetical protein
VSGFVGDDTRSNATSGTPTWIAGASATSAAGQYRINGTGLSATNYVFAQDPSNASALTLLISNRPASPPQQAMNSAVNSGNSAAQTINNAPTQTYTALPVATAKVVDATARTVAPEFGPLTLDLMSYDEIGQLLDSRKEFKKKLFADAIYKLVEDPSLAELRPCVSVVEVSSGSCKITPAQREQLAAARAQQIALERQRQTQSNLPKNIKKTVAALPQIERKYIVLFGIDRYTDTSIPSLNNAVHDAEVIGQLFRDKLGYDEVRVVKNATKADIVRTLNQLSTEVQKHDSVVIYYAGHGYLIDQTGVGYWLAADAAVDNPKGWISNKDISSMLADIPANQVAMISDSCYSGAFTKEQKVALNGQDVKPDEILVKRTVVVMSSGGEEPVADGGRRGHSIFAWQLMQTVQTVNSWTAGTNVFTEVQQKVHKRYPQTPQYGAAVSAGHQSGGDYLFESRQFEESGPQSAQ